MEIETATRKALAVLTFDERPLAQDVFNAQQTAKLQKRVSILLLVVSDGAIWANPR